jgi:hypothetical protein
VARRGKCAWDTENGIFAQRPKRAKSATFPDYANVRMGQELLILGQEWTLELAEDFLNNEKISFKNLS